MSEGRKDDAGKLRFHLLPPHAISECVEVLTYGAVKYNEGDWKFVKDLRKRYLSAALRHIFAFMKGETHDKESGKHNLACAAVSLLFILEFERPARSDV